MINLLLNVGRKYSNWGMPESFLQPGWEDGQKLKNTFNWAKFSDVSFRYWSPCKFKNKTSLDFLIYLFIFLTRKVIFQFASPEIVAYGQKRVLQHTVILLSGKQ